MTTKGVTINNNEYTQLTTQEDFLVQNNGQGTIAVAAAETQPPADADFSIGLAQGCAVSSSLITGRLWGKALSSHPVTVSVTE
jgi:hypothetical protein